MTYVTFQKNVLNICISRLYKKVTFIKKEILYVTNIIYHNYSQIIVSEFI